MFLVQVDNLFRQNERVSDFTLLDVGFVTIHAPNYKLSEFFQAGEVTGQTVFTFTLHQAINYHNYNYQRGFTSVTNNITQRSIMGFYCSRLSIM